jgi:siroheme synthase-like protein
MKTYPVNLVLENCLVILVGAKGEIVHKILGLLEAGARVRVIAPHGDAEVQAYAANGQIEWLARPYQPGDLAGAALVIAAARNSAVHEQIWAEGQANHQLVNVMDAPAQCNFHGASVVRRGQLTIAIGTGGAAPALAVTLRKRFEQEFGPEYGEFLDYAQALRPTLARRIPRFKQRVAFWYAWIDSGALDHLRNGNRALFEAETHRLLEHYAAEEVAMA